MSDGYVGGLAPDRPKWIVRDRRIVVGGGGSVLPNDLLFEEIWARHGLT